MKKFLTSLIFLAALCVGACASTSIKPLPQDYGGSHSAVNSLDYAGTYFLDGPAAGDEIRILSVDQDGAYSVTRANGERASGEYQWDVTGTVITLTGAEEEQARFFIGENFIKFVGRGVEEGRIYRKN